MLHEGESVVDETVAGELVAEQFPQWAIFGISRVASSGTSNVLHRIGDKLVARFPRTRAAMDQLKKERAWLSRLAPHLTLPIPSPVGDGVPSAGFSFDWSIYEWIEGEAFPESGSMDQPQVAADLASFILSLQSVDSTGGPAPGSHNFHRGVPLKMRDGATRAAIASLDGSVNTEAATKAWNAALEASGHTGSPTWIHGDLLPGNLLYHHGRLSAVIDFGGLGVGDPACDLMPAWNLFSSDARKVFRARMGVDDSTWIRGQGWALSQALIFVPYYLKTRPTSVCNALRAINEILSEQP